jgi:hypothetical protein
VDVDRLKAELKVLTSMKTVSNPDVVPLAEARFTPFIEAATQQLEEIIGAVNVTSSLLEATAKSFGETIDVAAATRGGDEGGSDQTQKFFSMIAEVVSVFKKAMEDIEQWRVEEQRAADAAEAAQQKAIRRSSLAAAASQSGADDGDEGERKADVEHQDNLFGRFRNQQQASPDDIISQLKAKMKLKQMRTDED